LIKEFPINFNNFVRMKYAHQYLILKKLISKYLCLLSFFLSFSAASAQNETSTDTIYIDRTPVALLKKIGTGFVAYSVDGKERLISIKENYYRFPNGLAAYPDVTVRSAEKTMEVILANKLFDKNGLNQNNVQAFVKHFSTPLPVKQIQREKREEINPEIR